MPTPIEEIQQAAGQLKETIEVARREIADKVKPLLQQFVADNPQVAEVRWAQYTPYFNDGDTCVFSVNEPYFKFVGSAPGGDDDDDDDDEGYAVWYLREARGRWSPSFEVCSAETAKACVELADMLSAIEDELEMLFGDHVEVVLTKDGVEVEEYEHD